MLEIARRSGVRSRSQRLLLDRARLLDKVRVGKLIRPAPSKSADDGELFLEYSQSEALGFDNGRLKQATYDTAQGFGLRAVKDDAVGYAHSSDVSIPALIRAADAVNAVRGGYAGTFAAAPSHTNVRLYSDDNPLDAPGFEAKVKLLAEIDAYVRDKDPRVRQVSVSLGAIPAGGRDPAPGRRELSRHPSAGPREYLRRRRSG